MRPCLPDQIPSRYGPVDDQDIRAESFGLLTAAQIHVGSQWRTQRGTFDDQSIFGPRRDFECACGKYFGHKYDGILCDQCGVKVALSDVRWTRCAHLNLPSPVPHPLGETAQSLTVLPVLLVAFVESPGGADLLRAYEAILSCRETDRLTRALYALVDLLAPLLVTAHRWNLPERRLIAHGIALAEVST